MELGIITAILVITIYILVVLLLWKTGTLDRLHISAFGPLLMFRTKRGVQALDRLALHDRFWRWYGNLSLGLVVFFGVMLALVLLWEVPLALRVPASAAPGPEMIIGLPGINPLIPLGYGIVALAIAIVVHEFSHGVLTRVAKVTVKSVGLLLFVVPIGAFVEPDEEQFKDLGRRKRARMYAVGPATNMLLAILCAGIFAWGFMGAVQPVEDGIVVTHVLKDYPAYNASIPNWALITEMGLSNGTNFIRVDGEQKFQDILSNTSENENITVVYLYRGERHQVNVTLANKSAYYDKYYRQDNKPEYSGKGFMGVGTMSTDTLPETLAHPLRFDSLDRLVASVAYFVGLPFFQLMPMESPLTDLYTVGGPLAGLPAPLFWILANTFYWLFWLNLMVGATNSLPIPKLDGGMVYKDGLEGLLSRIRPAWDTPKRERRATLIYRLTGLVIVFLIIWQFIGPRIGALF